MFLIYRERTEEEKQKLEKDKADRRIQCGHCEMRFKRKCDFNDHLKQKHGPPQHECEFCGQKFNYRSGRARHRKKCGLANLYNLSAKTELDNEENG